MKALHVLILCLATSAAFAQADFTHFEARQVHPIALTPDGSKLLAINSPDARLSVFNTSTTTPSLLAEIPVGLEPVSVRARTNDEAWVVSEVSDTVTVVSLVTGTVVATLRVDDEPADIVFARGKAFVSCARAGVIRIFDAGTRADLGSITLTGVYPRALRQCRWHQGFCDVPALWQPHHRVTRQRCASTSCPNESCATASTANGPDRGCQRSTNRLYSARQ